MATIHDLFEACRRGDAKAQRSLYDIFKGKLMGLSRRYTKNREEAQDVLQEAFVKIFTRFNQLEEPDKMEGWMKSIVVRTAINHYHRNKTRDVVFCRMPEHGHEGSVSSYSLPVTDEYLLTLIDSLPEGCRMIFNLCAIEGYSHVEIAEMLHISEGTSRSQFHHARHLLKEKMKCNNLARYYEKFA